MSVQILIFWSWNMKYRVFLNIVYFQHLLCFSEEDVLMMTYIGILHMPVLREISVTVCWFNIYQHQNTLFCSSISYDINVILENLIFSIKKSYYSRPLFSNSSEIFSYLSIIFTYFYIIVAVGIGLVLNDKLISNSS